MLAGGGETLLLIVLFLVFSEFSGLFKKAVGASSNYDHDSLAFRYLLLLSNLVKIFNLSVTVLLSVEWP